MTTLGSYLRDARVAAMLGLREVSARVGMDAVTWGEIERDKRTLGPEHYDRVLEVIPGLRRELLIELAEAARA